MPHTIQDAVNFIKNAITAGRFPRGTALPPLRQLSREIGVSYVTLWKAVRMLQKQGVLSSSPRQATKVVDPLSKAGNAGSVEYPDPKKLPPKAPRGVRRIKELIEQGIAEGVFERGTRLPLVKQFKSRYGAAYRTISEALRQLNH
jgi:DNA-binding GntR family transcriptional regulator